MANSVDPDQTAPIGAVCSGSTLFASILILSVMLGNYLQQTTSADNIFRCIFFLGTLRVNYDTSRKSRLIFVQKQNWKTTVYRGSYMSAHVLLNLLNKLGKRDKMRGLQSILSLFRNKFNKFIKTRA